MALQHRSNSSDKLKVMALPGLESSCARSMQGLRDRAECVQDVIAQSGDEWSLPNQQNERMILCQ